MTRVDRLGYWLLNVVVEHRFPLHNLQAGNYWKRLPAGHRIRFHLRGTEPGQYFRFDHPDLATSEFARGRPEWYTHPGI